MQGDLPAASLVANQSVGLVPLVSGAPAAEGTAPAYEPCLNCLSSKKADGTVSVAPQQLQWKLAAPLDEKTTYFAYVTTDAKDTQGKNVVATPTFALLRSASPLVDAAGKSTVSVVSDTQAQQLEPLRAALQPVFDGLAAKGVPRKQLALGFAFTTQSEATVLDKLHLVPSNPALKLPTAPAYVMDATASYQAKATAAGIPFDKVGKVFVGELMTVVAITGPQGTLNPSAPVAAKIPFVLTLPATPKPAGGYPIAIFGHDFTRSRQDLMVLANSLAAGGEAGIATDILFHGERTSCTGSSVATTPSLPPGTLPSDDFACADAVTQHCDGNPLLGRCVARDPATRSGCAGVDTGGLPGDLFCSLNGQGACNPTDLKCEGGDLKRDPSGAPIVSGWNLMNLTNLFATRDNLRQQVIDFSQLARVLGDASSTGLAGQLQTSFDPTKVGYVGQGLGGDCRDPLQRRVARDKQRGSQRGRQRAHLAHPQLSSEGCTPRDPRSPRHPPGHARVRSVHRHRAVGAGSGRPGKPQLPPDASGRRDRRSFDLQRAQRRSACVHPVHSRGPDRAQPL